MSNYMCLLGILLFPFSFLSAESPRKIRYIETEHNDYRNCKKDFSLIVHSHTHIPLLRRVKIRHSDIPIQPIIL
jgi:hypothetical protein